MSQDTSTTVITPTPFTTRHSDKRTLTSIRIRIGAFLATLLTFILFYTGVPYAQPTDDLYLAAGSGKIREVRKLLSRGVDPNAAVDKSGITALMQAASIGDTEILKLLLNKGANVNARAGQMGTTALMNAAAFGDVEMVRLLLDKGAEIDTKNTAGMTALSQAQVAKKHEIVSLLKAHGAKEKGEQQSFTNPILDTEIVGSKPQRQ